MAAATSAADAVPRSLSGAATTRIAAIVAHPDRRPWTGYRGEAMSRQPPGQIVPSCSSPTGGRSPSTAERRRRARPAGGAPGGLVSGIGPLVAGTDATWMAAAITDGDREAAAQGVVEADGFRVRLLAIDPETYRLAYDVVSNEVLWFAHHGLWDLPRQPAFDRRWADAWEAYRQVNRCLRRRRGRRCPAGCRRPRAGLPPLPGRGAGWPTCAPTSSCVHFSHTPFAPPVWLEALPDAAVERAARAAWPPTTPAGSTRSGGPTTSPSSARDLAGLDAHDLRVAVGVRPGRHPGGRRLARVCGMRWPALEDVGRRPGRDRAGRPDRALEEPAARLPGLRRPARALPRAPRSAWCSSPPPTRPARACPATPPTGRAIEAAVRRHQRSLRHRRLDADRARRRRRLPPLGRAHAPSRRAPREPHPRRPQPRGVRGCRW